MHHSKTKSQESSSPIYWMIKNPMAVLCVALTLLSGFTTASKTESELQQEREDDIRREVQRIREEMQEREKYRNFRPG